MRTTNVERETGMTQVCVWPGTIVGEDQAFEFEKFFCDEFNTRVQYLEEIKTNPDPGDPETGGRNDVFFAVVCEDIAQFAIPRLSIGVRWLEDVIGNGGAYLYPARVLDYQTWPLDGTE